MPESRPACRPDEIQPGRALRVVLEGLPIAIFRDGDAYHALLDRCPHQNTPLSDGWVEEGEAVCSRHLWRFKLATGRCTTMRGQSQHRFACEVREGVVWVSV